jgi:hypothetical protein
MAPLGVRRLHHRDVWSPVGLGVRDAVEGGMTPRLLTGIPAPIALIAAYLAAFLIWSALT